ncbi:MAG: hypothetical protein KDK70_29370 [Myxococcales bacterium]|nr:hypothetical protein [Myxococcales bacterium]
MIGYRVTATSPNRGYSQKISGWSEGSPKLEAKVKEMAAKQVVKALLKRLVGGPVVTVADIVSKPLQGLGSAAGNLIAQNLLAINRARADQGLQVYDIDATLTGDFEGSYRVSSSADLDKLPHMLALIPKSGTDDEYMGAGVLEAAFMVHVNFARYLYNMGEWDVSNIQVAQLDVKIEL